MRIYRNLILGSGLNYLLIVLYTTLRVMSDVIRHSARISCLEVMDAEALIFRKCLLHVPFILEDASSCFVVHPEGNALLICICGDLLKVKVLIRLAVVEMLVAAPVLPALVPAFEEHASDVVGCSKVDMLYCVFSSRSVARSHCPYMCSEMHSPPYADVFLRAYP